MKQNELQGIIATLESMVDIPPLVDNLTEYVNFDALSELFSIYSAIDSSKLPGFKTNEHTNNIFTILGTLKEIASAINELNNDHSFGVTFTEAYHDELCDACQLKNRASTYLNVFYANEKDDSVKYIQGVCYISGKCKEERWIPDITFNDYVDDIIDICD